ncbi:MAG: TonB-dependent receptor [Lentisphaeria bacterium]|nr:TonB-dependent receptor [Lentisphaeria bacterium]
MKRHLRQLVIAAILSTGALHAQIGHVLQGAGVINRSMEGASTGNPVDMCGALYWNVAGLTQMKRSMLCMGNEFFMADLNMESAYPGGMMLGDQDSGFPTSSIPTIGGVYKPKESRWTFAMGMQSIAGFGVEYNSVRPGAPNPILYPQSARGFGAVSSRYSMGQLTLGAAYQMTEGLSLGIAPVFAYSRLEVDPFPGVSPNASGYPDTDEADTYGYGVNLGALYRFNPSWSVGLSYRSEIDFRPFQFDATYPNGAIDEFSFDMDFPAIASAGVGYTNQDWGLTLNLDLRHLDYENTDGFKEDAEFDSTGAVKGFGWQSIWQIACGAQFKVTDRFTLRAGYSWNENPVESNVLFYNIHATAIIQHHASVGFSYQATESLMLNFAYAHGFENSLSGEMPGAPGSRVKTTMSTNSFMLGLGYLF